MKLIEFVLFATAVVVVIANFIHSPRDVKSGLAFVSIIFVLALLIPIHIVEWKRRQKYGKTYWRLIWWGWKGLRWGISRGFYLNEEIKIYKYQHLGLIQVRKYYIRTEEV